ncbi:VanZ family protein [Roseisolibacter sp. H3M3-2]|uniref:VanZ family protein n=1 Tax=Roseisolibacter sp. H3M3-2 TaxID=3031323 RepID=UPI0023DAAC4A|nr:VanZ family protein [Roseisolibacter sp. H3M3-2]MDF1502166.1 VanZ family protein [Roseisolibacter sp. H3M3-2]
MRRLLRGRWAPAALWALALVVATSWPNPDVGSASRFDKPTHAFLYGVLAWLVARAAPERLTSLARVLALLAAIAAFAALDEWHQAFIPGRSAGADDWAADVVGAAGALAAAALRRRRALAAA